MAPPTTPIPSTLPYGQTAQRLTWPFLPPRVRALVERHLGAEVVEATSQDGGFTPGFASILCGADGRSVFVKAASLKAQPAIAASYDQEARKRQLLDKHCPGVPAPRLLWAEREQIEDGWLVLGFENWAGRTPARPWRLDELEQCLDLAEEIAGIDPSPLGLHTVLADFPSMLTGWSKVAARDPGFPHLEDGDDLARSFADLPDRALCHGDLRDDNILLNGIDGSGGRAVACDWNGPVLGPAWLDTVDLLIGARGDGIDADALLARRAVTRDVDPDAIDSWLAAMCGHFLNVRAQPAPMSSPYLQAHGAWYADATWDWLADRRGWS